MYQNVNLTFRLYQQEFGRMFNIQSLQKEFSSLPPNAIAESFSSSCSSAFFGPGCRLLKMLWDAKSRAVQFEAEIKDIRNFFESNRETCEFEEAFSRLIVFAESYIDIQVHCFLFLGLLEEWLKGESVLPFISNLEGVESAEQAAEFSALIRLAREHGTESVEFQASFDAFLQIYGSFRACDELELKSKRWIADPTYLMSLIKSSLQNDAAAAAEVTLEENLELAVGSGVTAMLIDRCRSFCRLRENSKAAVVRLLSICRCRVVEVSAKFLRNAEEDVFFLTLSQFRHPPKNAEEVILRAKSRHDFLRKISPSSNGFVVRNGAFVPLCLEDIRGRNQADANVVLRGQVKKEDLIDFIFFFHLVSHFRLQVLPSLR